ncbi:MAG: UbiA family prenyltransferase [Acetobacteraceae bacterium]
MTIENLSAGGAAAVSAREYPARAPPLVVDLGGALLKVDALHESLIALVVWRPLKLLRALVVLIRHGRAAMKAMLASLEVLDIEALPLREEVVDWLREQAAAGRTLHLVAAADQEVVDRFGARLQIFESCTGGDRGLALQEGAKAAYLARRFPDGFGYVGDSATEMAVWRSASTVGLVGTRPAVRRGAERLNKPVEAEFPIPRAGAAVLLKQLRLHQWSKNVLVFLPLLLAHRFTDLQGWLHVLLAFFAMGLTASATYMVNDLSDLADDRRHATKRNRPLAAGMISSLTALAIVPLMLAAGFALAVAASREAAIALAAYLALTLLYSVRLKRVPLLDTAVIGLLFTLRILLGAAAVRTAPSPWLLAFSVMLFFSLAMAKRQSEIAKTLRLSNTEVVAGRGYQPGDAVLTLVYGITSGIASLVISMLYITNGVATELYGSPEWLWAVPLLLYLWQMRVWLLAHRGVLDDDPIVFALKDRISLALGAGCLLALYLAL